MKTDSSRSPQEIEILALRAIKIAIFACLFFMIFGSIGIWIMMNEVAALGQMSQQVKALEKRVDLLEH